MFVQKHQLQGSKEQFYILNNCCPTIFVGIVTYTTDFTQGYLKWSTYLFTEGDRIDSDQLGDMDRFHPKAEKVHGLFLKTVLPCKISIFKKEMVQEVFGCFLFIFSYLYSIEQLA